MIRIMMFFLLLVTYSFGNQQEMNKERQRWREKEIRKREEQGVGRDIRLLAINKAKVKFGNKLKEIKIKGNTILKEKEIKKIEKEFLGKKGVENIINLMKTLENKYLKKGYISVRVKVDIKKSNFQKGIVSLKVIEGFLESIRFKDKNQESKLKTFVSFPISQREILNINDLDQGIENLNSVSSNNAKLSLLPGKKFGGSIIELENKKSKKISGRLNLNNLGQESTGRNKIKLSLIFEDVLGINDFFMISYQRRLKDEWVEKNNNISIYFKIPVKYWEFSISNYRSEYLSKIDSVYQSYKTRGVSKNTIYSIRNIINRNSEGKTSIGGSLILKDTKNYIDDTKLESSSKRLSILKFDLDHQRRFMSGILNSNIAYYKGVTWLGAKKDRNITKTSPKAQFQKYTVEINWYKPFKIKKENFFYRTSLNGQYTDDILYSSENLTLGDDTTIRGFQEESISGEKGVYLRNELGYKYKFLEPFIGYDWGRVKSTYKGKSYKKNGDEVSGISVGIRTNFKYLEASAVYSKPLTAPKYIEKNTHELYLSMTLKF